MTLHQFIMDLFRPFITTKQYKSGQEIGFLKEVLNIIFDASTKRE